MPPKTTYPMECGCSGPKYISQCQAHQQMARDYHAHQLGVRGDDSPGGFLRVTPEQQDALERVVQAEIDRIRSPTSLEYRDQTVLRPFLNQLIHARSP